MNSLLQPPYRVPGFPEAAHRAAATRPCRLTEGRTAQSVSKLS